MRASAGSLLAISGLSLALGLGCARSPSAPPTSATLAGARLRRAHPPVSWARSFCGLGAPQGCEASLLALGPDGSILLVADEMDHVDPDRGVVRCVAVGPLPVRIPSLYGLAPDGRERWRLVLPPTVEVGHVAATTEGGALVAGSFAGVVDVGGLRARSTTGPGVFVARVDGHGRAQRVHVLESDDGALAEALLLRDDGSLVVAGSFRGGIDLDPGPGRRIRRAAGQSDAYVVALDRRGAPLWSVTWGGSEWDGATTLTELAAGGLLVTGHWDPGALLDPDLAAARPPSSLRGAVDEGIALVALDASGGYLWDRTIDESWGWLDGGAPAGDGSVGLTGQFSGYVEIDGENGPVRHAMAGWAPSVYMPSREVLLLRIDGRGLLRWSRTYLAGMAWATPPAGLADGSMVVGGSFDRALDLCPGPGVDRRVPEGRDGYVVGVDRDGRYLGALQLEGAGSAAVSAVAATADGALVVVGDFTGEIDLDPGPGQDLRVAESGRDLFVLRVPASALGLGPPSFR